MYYPEEIIEEIRLQNDVLDIISQYVRLNKKGNSHFGLCPFHTEKTPSFSVTQDKQMYYCFGCGAGGNVITFIMEYENYSFIEAVKYLADRVNISLPEPQINEEMRRALNYKQKLLDANKEAAKYFYYQLKRDLGLKALQYMKDRGIEEETRKKFGIGYSNFLRDDLYKYLINKNFTAKILIDSGLVIEEKNKPGAYHDRFFNRVMFPIFDIHNRVIGFGGRVLGDGNPKYLNSPETKLFDKGKNLYGLNIARTARKSKIILVEGYMDVITLHHAGFNNTVASLGTAFTNGQANLLRRYTDEVIIAYDSDKAGINAALRAIPILEASGTIVRVIKIPDYKDPDDYIKNKGNEAFEKLIDHATPSFMFEIEQDERKYNLSDPEHRTKFYQSVAKKLVELHNEIKRENYFEAVTQKYKIKPHALKAEMDSIGKDVGIVGSKKASKNEKTIKNRHSKDSIESAQRNLLTFIVSHRDIFDKVSIYIKPNEFPNDLYEKVALIIYSLYEENASIEPAMIINKFTLLEDQNKVANIFNNNINVDSQTQFEKIVNESIRIIKNAYIDKMSRHISETSDLQDLIKAKRELQALYISLNDG